MNGYRIEWHATVEDESLLEGRTLVVAENEHNALCKLIEEKMNEYHLKYEWIRIESIMMIPYITTEEDMEEVEESVSV